MNNKNVQSLVLAAMFLAIGMVLPFLTGNELFGGLLLPMHLPVLICGIILGPKYGALVGLVLPITRSLIIGMPPLFPVAVSMTFELAAYGGIIGLLYGKLPKNIPSLYISLVGAMLAGRVVWGSAMAVLLGLGLLENPFTFEIFLTLAFVNAAPGIILQIVFIPVLILALQKAGWGKMRAGRVGEE
jgi:thiamine transporter ThiT